MNYSAENALVTALFFDDPTHGTAADQAGILLGTDDFEDEGCRQVFRAVMQLRAESVPIELCHALEAMEKAGVKHDDALAWLVDSTNGSPLPGQIARYAEKIKANSRARKLRRTIGLAAERLQSGEPVAEVKSNLVLDLEEIEAEKLRSDDKPLADVLMPTLNAMSDKLLGDESKQGLRTGIADLDDMTSGINRGELWIAGAMPGRGKTALALQIAMNVAGRGFPVYMVSLEMSSSAVVRRLLKMHFGSHTVEHPRPAQWTSMLEYAADIKTLPLYINDSAALTAEEIAQHARVMVARHGTRLNIVDYLQIVNGPGQDRRERIGDVANVLRSLAKDTGVPVLALSQLRRPASLNDRPSMIELKESGDLEAHAHVVLLNYMPVDENGSFIGKEEIVIGKQREGPTGSIPVVFDRSKVMFLDRTMRLQP